MKALIIDTAAEGLVALATKEGVIVEKVLPPGRRSSQYLMSEIDRLVTEPFEIIIVGVGPGSYTGLRVGAAVAKVIAFARKLPLVPVSSLLAYGEGTTAFDARIAGAYLRHEGKLVATHELPDIPICTPHAKKLKERFGCNAVQTVPRAKYLARAGFDSLDTATTDGSLKLIYLGKHVS